MPGACEGFFRGRKQEGRRRAFGLRFVFEEWAPYQHATTPHRRRGSTMIKGRVTQLAEAAREFFRRAAAARAGWHAAGARRRGLATFGVATLLRTDTDCPCAESVPVMAACIVAEVTLKRFTPESTCASTQGSASSRGFTEMGFEGPALLAPRTLHAGACANTNTPSFWPVSCARGWMVAVALDTVGVMLASTAIGNTGGAEETLAVNGKSKRPSCVESRRLPLRPSQVPVYGNVMSE